MANTHRIAQPIELRNPYSNIDYNYGPYASKEAACAAIIKPQRLLGLTVAIEGDSGVEEYWFKEGVEDKDLVAKQRGGENTLYDTTTIYVDANPARKGGDGSMGNPFTNEECNKYLKEFDIKTHKVLIYLLDSDKKEDVNNANVLEIEVNKLLPNVIFENINADSFRLHTYREDINEQSNRNKIYFQNSFIPYARFTFNSYDDLYLTNMMVGHIDVEAGYDIDEITGEVNGVCLYAGNLKGVRVGDWEESSILCIGVYNVYLNNLQDFDFMHCQNGSEEEIGSRFTLINSCYSSDASEYMYSNIQNYNRVIVKNSHIKLYEEGIYDFGKKYHFINSVIEGISDENLLQCTLDDITYATLKSKLLVKEEKVNLNEKSELQLDWSIKNNKLYNVDLQGTNTSGFIINTNGLKADSTYNETTLLITNATTTNRSVEIVGEEMKNAVPKFSLPPNQTAEVIIKAYGTWSSMTAIALGEWEMEIIA